MTKENGSADGIEEIKILYTKKPVSTLKATDAALETYDLQKNGRTIDVASGKETDFVERTVAPSNEWIKIRIWRRKIVHVNRSLIPLRSAFFFWFASGSLCSPLFGLMLVNRGFPLNEFSSIFSVIFVFQVLISYITGIIADKLGAAKPVLLFLMLGTVSVIIVLLLSPSVKINSCVNATCSDVFNDTSNLEQCKYICSINKTDGSTIEVENKSKNGSIFSSEVNDVLSKSENFNNVSYSNGMTDFCNDTCSCFGLYIDSCTHENKAGFKILYAAITLSFFPLWSTSYRFLDFAALNAAKQYRTDLGRERFFGNLGVVVVTLLCNFVLGVDKSRTKSYYDNLYWCSVVLLVLSTISACKIRDVRVPPGIKLSKKTMKLFTDIEIMPLLLVSFAAGVGFTFNKFFHLMFLDSLDASKTVIGLHITASSFFGLPIYLTSKSWLKKFGEKKILIVGLLSYTISSVSYSFLYYPWVALIIEITNAFSFDLFWIALVILSSKVAPEGLPATVNAIVGAIHFGIGRSFSVAVGGYLFSKYGARAAYRLLAVFCLVVAILYSMLLYLRHILSKKTREEQNKEEMKGMKENEA